MYILHLAFKINTEVILINTYTSSSFKCCTVFHCMNISHFFILLIYLMLLPIFAIINGAAKKIPMYF